MVENSQWAVFGIGAAAVIVGLVLAFLGYRGRKKLGVMASTQTVSASEAVNIARNAPGRQLELVGAVAADEPLLSPTGKVPCVYYSYKLEHRVQKRERDDQGNWHAEESWKTVESREEQVPFRVCDSSGECMVFPDGADIVAETRTVDGPGTGREYMEESGVVGGILDSVLDAMDDDYESVQGYRITEAMIRVGQPVFVHGTVKLSGEFASLGRGDGPFIVSYRMEEELSRKYRRNSALQYTFAAILAIAGIVGMVYAVAFMAK
ncbi:MAG: GIDE domain-containing protein [Actinomycetota bacterium]